ncbi:MAG TPA: hypothetical protein VNO17_00340 [Actinomycetota bacterium]|nr:hypothetical protein [Actinomycetota bacterium]
MKRSLAALTLLSVLLVPGVALARSTKHTAFFLDRFDERHA